MRLSTSGAGGGITSSGPLGFGATADTQHSLQHRLRVAKVLPKLGNIESLINAFEREPALIQDWGASDISYFPDHNRGVMEFTKSIWDVEVNGFAPAGDNSSNKMEFNDDKTDFKAQIRRVVTIEFTILSRLAMSLTRANRDA